MIKHGLRAVLLCCLALVSLSMAGSIWAQTPISIWVTPDFPADLHAVLDPLIASGQYTLAGENQANLKITSQTNAQTIANISDPAKSTTQFLSYWVYVPVVPFPTVTDNIAWKDIQRYWQGDINALSYLSANKQPPAFVADPITINWLNKVLGAPAANVPIRNVPADAVTATLWSLRPASWSIVPFEHLDPKLKTLTLDNLNVFDRAMSILADPLTQTITMSGDQNLSKTAAAALTTSGKWTLFNRDPNKMTILVMTGTTALTRATAYKMETEGITLPLRDVAPFLQDADVIHTSNEVSFTPTCPYPSFASRSVVFCSRDTYFELFKAMRLNVVEATGNHMNDWGIDAFTHTLDLYDQNKIAYFGGGRNINDARKGIIVSVRGTKIAFIGCNPVGPIAAWATETTPGAAKCDDAFLSQEIPRLKAQANVVIMTIQFQEYYQYNAPPDQVAFFKKYADFGADLVMGSQAHQPQAFTFSGKAFIHYGIGNIFFDQMDNITTRQMFADKIILYNGKHISTVLFTGLNEDYSRVRPMTAAERVAFLTALFKASGW